jgi:hypothetical protein
MGLTREDENDNVLVYKIPLMVNQDSERRQERPKKRWLHNVENDLRDTGVRRRTLVGSKMMAGRREGMGSDFQRG